VKGEAGETDDISTNVIPFSAMNLIIDESNARIELASRLSSDEVDVRALDDCPTVHFGRSEASCDDGLFEARDVAQVADRWLRCDVRGRVDGAFAVDGDVIMALSYENLV
jgi:hypothetical protein